MSEAPAQFKVVSGSDGQLWVLRNQWHMLTLSPAEALALGYSLVLAAAVKNKAEGTGDTQT